MWLITFLRQLFRKSQSTGLLLDTPDRLNELPEHELFAGGGNVIDWKTLVPPFRYQGSSTWCTAFAGATIAHIFEKREAGGAPLFSPMELFYRSGGTINGNYLINAANAMQESVVLEKDVPTPVPTSWGYEGWQKHKIIARAPQPALTDGKKYATKSSASVKTDSVSLRRALSSSPLMIAIGIGKGYWDDPAPRQTQYGAYHAVVLLDIDPVGNYIIFDSLTQRSGFNGMHKLVADYEILYALSFIDLPDNWQGVQEEQRQIRNFNALDHYGFDRVLSKEQEAAKALSVAAKKFPVVAGIMGSLWLVIINAVAYGGFSVQDVLNDAFNRRRTNKVIFDYNKLRKDQGL